jgi:hypothetical protein
MEMTKESNDSIVFRVMRANTDKTRDEVVAILMEEVTRVPPAVAAGKTSKEKWLHTYYAYGIRKGIDGQKGTSTRLRKASVPKAARSNIARVPAPRIAGDREKASINKSLTVEEINDIKAKNMARMQAVARKYSRSTDMSTETNVTQTAGDSFEAPAFLKMADVKALV